MNFNERANLELLRNGSTSAFEALYDIYSGKLYNFALKITGGNHSISQEIVQSTFVKIWEKREYVNPDKSFLSYLCTIAKNIRINAFAHTTVKMVYEQYCLTNSESNDSMTEKTVDIILLNELIDRLTEQLPPSCKEVFVMSRKQFLSNRRIAQELHVSENTIEKHLGKALSIMRRQLTLYLNSILL